MNEATDEEITQPPSTSSQRSASSSTEENQSTAAIDSATPRHGLVSVDPLGFLLFGPSVNTEFAIGQVGVGAGFRWFSPGLLANELFLGSSDAFAFSYGFAARGQYYFFEPLAGPHVGVALDYLHVRVESDDKGIATISDYHYCQKLGHAAWVNCRAVHCEGGCF